MASDAYQYQAAKLHEIKKTLQGVLDGFHEHPEQIAEMLAFKSQFYNYSMNNAALIHSQNPNVTYVASFQDWKKKGYHVRGGQHGLKVLFPIRTELIQVGETNGKKQYRRVSDATPEEKRLIDSGQLKPVAFTRFGIGTVFDISQTDCPPEKYPAFFHMGYSSEQHAALYQAVKEYAEKKGIPVHEADLQSISLRGDYNLLSGEIRISDKLNDTERLSTLTHELGHALMHSDPKAMQLSTEVAELEADCVSIMLQHYVGLELTDARKRHFVDYYNACLNNKNFKIEDILKEVNMAYFKLHQELEPIFDRLTPEKGANQIVGTQTQEKPDDAEDKEQKDMLMAEIESCQLPDSLNRMQQAALRTAVKHSILIGQENGNQCIDKFFNDRAAEGSPVSQKIHDSMIQIYGQMVKSFSASHPVPAVPEEPVPQKEAAVQPTEPEQKAPGKIVPQYNHFYYENQYLFTVAGEKVAQEVYDRLTNETNRLGYFWSDGGKVYISDQKEAPVSDLWNADKTKTAYVPFTEELLQQHIQGMEKGLIDSAEKQEQPYGKPSQSKKEVHLEDLAIGQHYYDNEIDDDWHFNETKSANEAIEESKAHGGSLEYGPPMSDSEIKKMFEHINNHREIVQIDNIYQQDGKTIIDTSCGEIPLEDFLKRINDGKAILEPENVPGRETETVVTAPQKEPKPQSETPLRDYKEQDAAVLDQIKYGVSIITLASDMGFTPKQIGGYYTLKEHDSVRIYPETNSFTQFSSGKGGSTIDFVMNFKGYNQQDAIRYLKEKYAGNVVDHPLPQPEKKKAVKVPVKKEFKLPERAEGKFSRAFAYLTKTRCLDPEIVQQCFKDGLIYEDIKHNAVFVGKDADGKAAYATRRSTLTKSNFKCDVAGSRQDVGFFISNPSAEKLYICEAPIDALSIMSLLKKQGKPLDHANYLATGGTGKDAALYTRLRENPKIREVVLANDHDKAGWKANKIILEKLSKNFPHIRVAKLDPKQGKDINEYLQNHAKSPKTKQRGTEVER